MGREMAQPAVCPDPKITTHSPHRTKVMRSLTCAQVFLLYTHTRMYFERFPPIKKEGIYCLSASTLGSAGVIQTWCRRRRAAVLRKPLYARD
jgi:hypothetical protein